MKIIENSRKNKIYMILWFINILTFIAWFFHGDAMVKMFMAFIAVFAVVVLDVIICCEPMVYLIYGITIGIVQFFTGMFTCLNMDDPSFHGCLDPIFYIIVELIMFMILLFPIIGVGLGALYLKESIRRKKYENGR